MAERQPTMRALRTFACCAAGWLLAACASAPPAREGWVDRVDALVQAELARQQVPGAAVVVVRRGQVAKLQGYGLANVEHAVPVGPSTVFQSGSLGKQFTALAVMLQVEDGKLALDDPIARFLPDAPPAWQAITVRHLLTHTSGIPDYTEGLLDTRRDFSEDELARFAFGLTLEFEPGTRWSYSNTGYVLLGIIVHKVSGQFYGDVLRERVFAPLGMASARIISEEDIVAHRAAGYRLVKGALKNQEWVSPTLNTTADGSLYLSANDFVAWEAGIRARAILRPESWVQVLQPVRLRSGRGYPYGFGWFLDEVGGHARQHHSGEWQGFSTYIARYPDDDLTIVALCNLADAAPGRIVERIAGLVQPGLAPPARVPLPVDPEPQVAERLAAWLRATRAGELAPADFAYLRAGFFPTTVGQYRELLLPLGAILRSELLDRRQLGDDWVYEYRTVFASGRQRVRLAIAPDGRLADFAIEPDDPP